MIKVTIPGNRIFKLAKCVKLVVPKRFGDKGLYFIEPVRIDEMGAANEAKLLEKANLKKVFQFKLHHPTVGYDFKYIGPNIEECLLAIVDNMPRAKLDMLYEYGGAFSVKECANNSYDFLNGTASVVITVYKGKHGYLPSKILNQPVNYRGATNEQEASKFALTRSIGRGR